MIGKAGTMRAHANMAPAHRQDLDDDACNDPVLALSLPIPVPWPLPVWYAIYALDHADSLEPRKAARPAHVERLQQLRDAGRLLLAGPFPAIDAEDPGPAGFSGSLIVAEFSDLAAAQAWADADPYLAAGVYREVSVRPFRKVLP
jgi:uncharacterized protein YciI